MNMARVGCHFTIVARIAVSTAKRALDLAGDFTEKDHLFDCSGEDARFRTSARMVLCGCSGRYGNDYAAVR